MKSTNLYLYRGLIYLRGKRNRSTPNKLKRKDNNMKQSEFKRMMNDSKVIINNLISELVYLRALSEPNKELIKEKEKELKLTVENVSKNFLLYYGVE